MQALISVVIPTHNRGKLILRALESVLCQSWRQLEVLVVDDASTDDTGAVMREVHDPRVRYIRLDQQHGAAGARNVGVRESKGQYIAFQDSDDLWQPEKLAQQMDCMAREQAGMVFCAFERCHEDGTVWQVFPHPDIQGGVIRQDMLLFENLASTQTMLFEAALMKRLLFDERYPALEDWELALRAAAAAKVVYLPEKLVQVTMRQDSLSQRQDKALAALRLLYTQYGKQIRADERVCRQWLAGFVHAGRGCGYRAWRECLGLMDRQHSLKLNAAILIRAVKELIRPV